MGWREATKSEVLARSGGDPFVACQQGPDEPGLVGELGWAAFSSDGDRAGVVVVLDAQPDPAQADELVAMVNRVCERHGWRPTWFATHDGIELPLPAPWQDGARWVWMSATQIAPADRRWHLIELDDDADAAELRAFALPLNPLWEGDPGEQKNRLWLGTRDASGKLIGCGAVHPTPAGVGHLAGLVVDPSYRRQGLGRALVIGLSRAVLAADGISTLSAYAENRNAIGLYQSVGYRLDHRFHSRFREPRRP